MSTLRPSGQPDHFPVAFALAPLGQGCKWPCTTSLPCNFRPVQGRTCAPLAAFKAKGVHCMCRHATRAHIRRRCAGDASSRETRRRGTAAPCAQDGPARAGRRGRLGLRLLAVAVAIALLVSRTSDTSRRSSCSGSCAGTPLVLQVRFEFGGGYASPEQLAFIPLLLIAPLPYVPLLIAAAGVLAAVPDIIRGSWHSHRWLNTFSDSWAALGGCSSSPPSRPATWTAPTPRRSMSLPSPLIS